MNSSLTLAILFAILAPIVMAFVNTFDKFLIVKRVKSTLGYTAVAGIAVLILGVILSLFLDWSSINFIDSWPAVVSGIIFGLQYFLYYQILKKADVSNYTGLVYFYPIPVAILSFIFLREVLSLWAYFGVLISIFGAIILSLRIGKINGKRIFLLIGLSILMVALYEFLIKIATTNLPEWNGIAIEFIFIGLTICFCLFSGRIRKEAFTEIKNLRLAFFSEFFTLMSIAFTFFAMVKLSPTVVATIATIEPFVIIIFERTLGRFFGKIYKDKITLWRLISILLTVMGVIIVMISTN